MATEEIADFFNREASEYESMHLSRVDRGMEGKATLAASLPVDAKRVLDIGAGTGLELESVFGRFPDLQVTVVDISEEMLGRLRERFAGRNIQVVTGDYFTADFGSEPYDAVITSMTLHHWTPEEKRELYPRFYAAVRPGGMYLENDYILNGAGADAEESRLLAERRQLDAEHPGIRHVHMDVPATLAHEMQYLEDAGFSDVQEIWSADNNVTLSARKKSET